MGIPAAWALYAGGAQMLKTGAAVGGTGLLINKMRGDIKKSSVIQVMERLWKDKSKAPGPQWSKVKTNVLYAKEALALANQIWSSHETEIKKSGTTQSKPGTFSTNKNDEVYLAQEGVPANYTVINGQVVYRPHGRWFDLKSKTWSKLGLTDDPDGQLTVDQFKQAFPRHWRSPSDLHNLASANAKVNRANLLKVNNNTAVSNEVVSENKEEELKINKTYDPTGDNDGDGIPNNQDTFDPSLPASRYKQGSLQINNRTNEQVVPKEEVKSIEQKEKLTRPDPWIRGRGPSLNKADKDTMAYLRQEGFGGAVDSLRGPSLRELLRDIRTDRAFMPKRGGQQYLHFGGKVYKAER